MGNLLKANRKYQHLYAIVRHWTKADEKAPVDLRFSVTKVVSDGNYAEREVNRLNELNADKDYYYFTQITRFEEVPIEAEPIAPVQLSLSDATPAEHDASETDASTRTKQRN